MHVPANTGRIIVVGAGAERFQTDASFALQSGTAPIPCSSGKRTQHRLNRGGDRQLNHALHIVAVTRARHDPDTRADLARKEAEGKTKKGALRCLKRHLARRFHRLLSPSAQARPQPHDATRADTTTVGAAPMPMVCLT
jgi:transposase